METFYAMQDDGAGFVTALHAWDVWQGRGENYESVRPVQESCMLKRTV